MTAPGWVADHPHAWFTHDPAWWAGVDAAGDVADRTTEVVAADGAPLAFVPCVTSGSLLVSGLHEPAGPLLTPGADPGTAWRAVDAALAGIAAADRVAAIALKLPVLGRGGHRPPAERDVAALRGLGYAVREMRFFCMDLTRGEDELLAAMSPRVRTQIRAAARRCDVHDVDGRDPAALAALCDVYAAHAAAKGTEPLFGAASLGRLLAASRTFDAVAQLATVGGEAAGFSLSFATGTAATVFAWGARLEARSTQLSKLLVWRALLALRDRGVRIAEYGGSVTSTAQHAGLAEFYRRLGGTVLPTAWAVRRVPVSG